MLQDKYEGHPLSLENDSYSYNGAFGRLETPGSNVLQAHFRTIGMRSEDGAQDAPENKINAYISP